MKKTIVLIIITMLICLAPLNINKAESISPISINLAKFENNKIEVQIEDHRQFENLELDYKIDDGKWLSEDFDNLITLTYNAKTRMYEHKFKEEIKYSMSFDVRIRAIVNAQKSEFSNTITFNATLSAKNYDAWAADAIHRADSLGIVTETMREDMKAEASRLEFVEALIKALEYKKSIKDYEGEEVIDTKSTAVKKAYKIKLLTYNESKTFAPDRKITREEVAVILDKLAIIIKLEDKFENKVNYDDASEWAKSAIDSVIKKGLLLGDNKLKFNPKKNMTRQEVLVTVLRVLD